MICCLGPFDGLKQQFLVIPFHYFNLNQQAIELHSVSEYKKRYIRNSTQILENLRNALVGFFGLRNEFASVKGNKKRSTQNIQIKKQKKPNALCGQTKKVSQS